MKKPQSGPQKAEKKMTDKPKPWPYNAKEARDKSAEWAQVILREMKKIIERSHDTETLRGAAISQDAANMILRHMESQGAPTRPN